MKKSIKILIFSITITALFCGCKRENALEESKTQTVTVISKENEEKALNNKLLGVIKEKEIYLYGKWSEEGSYEQILLKNGNKEKEFNWKGIWKEPELLLSDLNSDGKEELVTIITTGYGTGFLQQEIHIINLDTMTEFTIENPVNIVKDSVKTKLSSNKVIFSVGKETAIAEIEPMLNSIAEEYKSLIYGTFMRYYVDNNTIKVSVDSKTNPGNFLAEFEVSYKFENNNFKKDKVMIKEVNK